MVNLRLILCNIRNFIVKCVEVIDNYGILDIVNILGYVIELKRAPKADLSGAVTDLSASLQALSDQVDANRRAIEAVRKKVYREGQVIESGPDGIAVGPGGPAIYTGSPPASNQPQPLRTGDVVQ
jgi:hypothetical protein